MVNSIRHIVVRGRVQGVGFRAFVEDEAERRGLSSWVRNRRDGTVEAIFEGETEVIANMIAACRAGPPGSRVDALDEHEARPDESSGSRQGRAFNVLPTA